MNGNKSLREFEKGIFFTVLSGICLSLYSLFSKLSLSLSSIPLWVFLRFLIPLFLLVPVFLWRKTFFRLHEAHFSHQIARGCCVVTSQFAFFYYLSHGTLFNATLLISSGPVFMPIIARIIFKKPISWEVMVSSAISLLGVALILKPGHGIFSMLSFWGLLAGVAVACSQVLYGANVEKEHNDENLFFLFAVGALISFPILMFSSTVPLDHLVPTLSKVLFHSGLASWSILGFSIAAIGNQVFRGIAYRHGDPISLSPFLFFTVVFTAFYDWIFFDNVPKKFSVIGAGLIIIGAFMKWAFEKYNSTKE